MFLKFDGELTNDKFVSFVILSYKRPDMTQNLVESIHRHADMPFEIIVHDDSSDDETKQHLFNIRNQISTTIFGNEINMGLAASFNRGAALANSNYIIMLNNDALMLGPGLRDIVKVLDIPYIGAFGPWQVVPTEALAPGHVRVKRGDTSFFLNPYTGSGSIMAFRKAAWIEIGGAPQVGCGASDTALMRKFLLSGYFNATRLTRGSEIFTNVDFPKCERSTIGSNKFDGSYPQIFNSGQSLEALCRQRWGRMEAHMREQQNTPSGYCNDHYWHHYFVDNVISEQNNFNWDNMIHHQRFREQVEEDRIKR